MTEAASQLLVSLTLVASVFPFELFVSCVSGNSEKKCFIIFLIFSLLQKLYFLIFFNFQNQKKNDYNLLKKYLGNQSPENIGSKRFDVEVKNGNFDVQVADCRKRFTR